MDATNSHLKTIIDVLKPVIRFSNVSIICLQVAYLF